MTQLLTSNVGNKERFLAATLLYAGTKDNCTWLLGQEMRIKILELDLYVRSEIERVKFSVEVYGRNNHKVGTINKEYSANSIRENWVQTEANHIYKQRSVLIAQSCASQLNELSKPIEQISWQMLRGALQRAYEEHGPTLGQPVDRRRREGKGYVRADNGKLSCSCVMSLSNKDRMCDHVAHALITGADADVLNYKASHENNIRQIRIPIGLGYYWPHVNVGRAIDTETNRDTKFLLAGSTLENNLLLSMGMTPDMQSPYLFGENEGIFGYVQYIEDLVLCVPQYIRLIEMSTEDLISKSGCPNYHRQTAQDIISKHGSIRNPYRDAWLTAMAASIVETETCLACKMIGGVTTDAPDIS